MRWFLLSLLLLLLGILSGSFMSKIICGDKTVAPATVTEVVAPVEEPKSTLFSVMSNGATIATAANGFYFLKDSEVPTLDTDMNGLLDKVATHLKDNPDTQLSLIGSYESAETNQTDYPNLGLARAISIQELLLEKGVNEKQLLVSGENTQIDWEDDKLYNGVSFTMNSESIDESYSDEELLRSMQEDQMVYFKTSKQSVLISPQLQSYLNKVKIFTQRNPGAQIYLTGHTDNTGKLKDNTRLGRKRAEFIEEYMKELGIEASVIVNSRGPSEPIADNETKEGRSKNRRVEIKVIK